MNHLNGVITQDLVLDKDTAIHGIINGNILVKQAIIFNLIGIVNGDIKISSGSRAEINGTLNGNLVNEGTCSVYGIVEGQISNLGGKMYIDPDAITN